jgi:DNA mismatch endonuclease (patch repair protein)
MTDRRSALTSPPASDAATLRRMRTQRRASTHPEVQLRRILWQRGFRYRVDAALPLPGVRRRADLLFPASRVAVFVDGCFWHSCPEHGTRPKSNSEWWETKLRSNAERDRNTDDRLREAGWEPVRVWEHEDLQQAARHVADVVSSRRP